MSTLNINLDEVPDSLTIEPGVYKAQVTEVPQQQANKKGTGSNLVVECVILEGKYSNFKVKDYIPLSSPIHLKQLCKAVGVTADGGQLNLEELVGKDFQIVVTNTSTTKDKNGVETGKTVVFSNVEEYLPA